MTVLDRNRVGIDVINNIDIYTEIRTILEIITPDRARNLLELNTNNRPVIAANLAKLCDEIQRGRFVFNGDAIRISKTGRLLDGQHRLLAVVRTGISIETLVVTGLNDECFKTIDQGSLRTLAALLSIEGATNYTMAAASIMLIQKYLDGHAPTQGSTNARSKTDLVDFYNENKANVLLASSRISTSKLKKLISPGYLAFIYFTLHEINKNHCELFFSRIENGDGLVMYQPELVLREKLISVISSSNKESQVTRAAYFIFAWNAFRKNKQMKVIRWTRQGDNSQEFPRAI